MIREEIFEPRELWKQPLHRVGYSDRTAWFMAALSELAYLEFESSEIDGLINDLAAAVGRTRDEVVAAVRERLSTDETLPSIGGRERLKRILQHVGFELLCTFDEGGTQGFMARREAGEGLKAMTVLAFRGTEKKLGDWKTDLRVALRDVGAGRIHSGFVGAYQQVRPAIEAAIEREVKKKRDVRLFVTGHSLGGALAVVATRFLPAERLAACYTFGSPRVGDRELSKVFRTPIYRVVNASDAVPRVPVGGTAWVFGKIMGGLTHVLPRWRFLDSARTHVERVTGYVHYGDMRYLTACAPGSGDGYPGLMVIANPPFLERLRRFLRRVKDTKGQGMIKDHAIGIYRRKLKAYARARNVRPGQGAGPPVGGGAPLRTGVQQTGGGVAERNGAAARRAPAGGPGPEGETGGS